MTFVFFFHLLSQSDLLGKILVLFFALLLFFVLFLQCYFGIVVTKKLYNFHSDLLKLNINDTATVSHFTRLLLQWCDRNREKSKEQKTDILYGMGIQYIAFEKKIQTILSLLSHSTPLIGLLGTVWGIMHAFIGLSQEGGGSIASMAPGIAGALTTTFAGLCVAIPSLIFFQWNALKIKTFQEHLIMILAHVIGK